MATPSTIDLLFEHSTPTEPWPFLLALRTPLLLISGCAPLLVLWLGWSAWGPSNRLLPIPIPFAYSKIRLHHTASSTGPC